MEIGFGKHTAVIEVILLSNVT